MVHRTLGRSLPVWLGIVGVSVLSLASAPSALADAFDDAKNLWKTGKYAESKEVFDQALKDLDKPDARAKARHALGVAAALESQGEYGKAREELESALVDQQDNADLLAALAEIQFNRGHWDEATAQVEKALKADPDNLRARWVQAQHWEASGEREKSVAAYEWFMDYQNNHPAQVARDAEALVTIGQAAERYYRAKATGEDLANGLNEVINTVYESALRATRNAGRPPGSKAASSSPDTRNAPASASSPAPSASTPTPPRSSSPWERPTSRLQARRRPQTGGRRPRNQPPLRTRHGPAGRPEHFRRTV